MSITDVQKALADHPSAGNVTMQYDRGGKFEIYQMGNLSIRVPAGASPAKIRTAFDDLLRITPGT